MTEEELRLESLRLSMQTPMLDSSEDAIVKRALKYFHFLKGHEGLLEDDMKNA